MTTSDGRLGVARLQLEMWCSCHRMRPVVGQETMWWEPMDLGGFVEMYGNDRTIGFSNCEKYFAKAPAHPRCL